MRIRILPLTYAVLLNAVAGTAARAQVTAWEVRRACSQADSEQNPQVKALCGLEVPERDVGSPVSWAAWQAWMARPAGEDAQAAIRTLVSDPDPASLSALHVYTDLPTEQQRMLAAAHGLSRRSASELRAAPRELLVEAARTAGRQVSVQDLLRDEGLPRQVRDEIRAAALRSAPEVILEGSYNALDGLQKIALSQTVRGDRVASAGQPVFTRPDFAVESVDELGRAAQGSAAVQQLERNILARMSIAQVTGLSRAAEQAHALRALENATVTDVIASAGLSRESRQLLFEHYIPVRTVGELVQVLRPEQQDAVLDAAGRTPAALPQSFANLNALISTDGQAALVSGAAAFIAGRVEQQVQVHLLRNLSNHLCSAKLKPALPSTCAVLSTNSLGTFQPGLAMLNSSVKNDLRVLPPVLMRLVFEENQQRLDEKRLLPAAQVSLQAAHFVAHALRGEDPRLTLVALGDAALLKDVNVKGLPASALLAQLAHVYLTRVDATRTGYEALPGLNGFREELRYMLMALAVNTRAGIHDLDFQPWQAFPVALWAETQIQQLDALRSQLASATPATVAAKRGEYASAGLRLIEGALSRPELRLPAEAASLREHVLSLRGIAGALAAQDYSQTFVELTNLLQQYHAALPAQVLPEGSLRVMSFVTEIGAAPDAAGVSAALTRLAGSGTTYIAKRARPTVTLNAFGGVLGGWETVDEDTVDEQATFAGPYLPVGVDVGLFRIRKVGVVGLFLQAVDLGALASWRFSDEDEDEVESEPELGFAQVFAPGIFPVLHVAGSPLTVGFGWSRTPGLRAGSNAEGEESPPRFDASRWGAFIAFDVPLFP